LKYDLIYDFSINHSDLIYDFSINHSIVLLYIEVLIFLLVKVVLGYLINNIYYDITKPRNRIKNFRLKTWFFFHREEDL